LIHGHDSSGHCGPILYHAARARRTPGQECVRVKTPDPSRPDLSVVIPTFGKADTLPMVLKHLEAQTLPLDRFEVVVIDDGSPDATAAGRASWARTPRLAFRHFAQENRGVSATRNRGAQEARASIVLLIQDDILAAPDLLERHLALHAAHP